VLSLASFSVLEALPTSVHAKGDFLSFLPVTAQGANDVLLGMLVVAPAVLLLNVFVDAAVLRSRSREVRLADARARGRR